ncbi:MAG: hypothetical protein KJ915_13025 [Candidatus Omnitrophica bacterium]|nr:hypothetical protein [Candidatus Omnitrophota bacterium]
MANSEKKNKSRKRLARSSWLIAKAKKVAVGIKHKVGPRRDVAEASNVGALLVPARNNILLKQVK